MPFWKEELWKQYVKQLLNGKIMIEMKFSNETIELAMDFIKSVEERMIELKNNPELLREVSDKHDYLYHDNQEVKVLTAERFLTLCLKDGRIIGIRELKNDPVGELSRDKKEREIEQGVEIFKQIEKLFHEGLIETGKEFDIKGIDKLVTKNIAGKEEDVVFDSVTNVLYFRTSIISMRLCSYLGEERPQNTVEKRLSKIPAFIGFVRAHRFENACSSCMAFNYDVLNKNYNVCLTSHFEDLKSSTYDSESK